MKILQITTLPGFDEWRNLARQCLQGAHPPEDILWLPPNHPGSFGKKSPALSSTSAANQAEQQSLLTGLFPQSLQSHGHGVLAKPSRPGSPEAQPPKVPKEFMDLACLAACHSQPERFALLYRILWRLTHHEKNLLRYETDDDILALTALVKAVRRDAYKIKAYLRFREVKPDKLDNLDSAQGDGKDIHQAESHFVSWYEPEHYTLELSLPFFRERFKNMLWTILTPYRAAIWDRQELILQDNPDPGLYPQHDDVEAYWLKYYASTFNPARIKVKAMLNQMPKKYWKNMPETVLIEGMLRNAEKFDS